MIHWSNSTFTIALALIAVAYLITPAGKIIEGGVRWKIKLLIILAIGFTTFLFIILSIGKDEKAEYDFQKRDSLSNAAMKKELEKHGLYWDVVKKSLDEIKKRDSSKPSIVGVFKKPIMGITDIGYRSEDGEPITLTPLGKYSFSLKISFSNIGENNAYGFFEEIYKIDYYNDKYSIGKLKGLIQPDDVMQPKEQYDFIARIHYKDTSEANLPFLRNKQLYFFVKFTWKNPSNIIRPRRDILISSQYGLTLLTDPKISASIQQELMAKKFWD